MLMQFLYVGISENIFIAYANRPELYWCICAFHLDATNGLLDVFFGAKKLYMADRNNLFDEQIDVSQK